MTRRIACRLLAVVATFWAMNGAVASGGAMYTVTDLKPLPGETGTVILGMSRSGLVLVGTGVNGGSGDGFYVYNSGTVTPLSSSVAIRGINDSGQLATTNANSAFDPVAINNQGQVVGSNYQGDLLLQGARGVVNLGHPPSFVGSITPFAINDAGAVIGFGNTMGVSRPFIYSTGHFSVLNIPHAAAYGINDSGQVVGGAMNGWSHPFLYQNGKVIDLGNLGGDGYGLAFAINNLGQIVGHSAINQAGLEHAFLYQNGMMSDLNDLIPPGGGLTLLYGLGIDDQGRIAVEARDAYGVYHALLLTRSVPEPSSSVLLAIGIFAYLVRRRHRRAP